jgi:hypothetical protein
MFSFVMVDWQTEGLYLITLPCSTLRDEWYNATNSTRVKSIRGWWKKLQICSMKNKEDLKRNSRRRKGSLKGREDRRGKRKGREKPDKKGKEKGRVKEREKLKNNKKEEQKRKKKEVKLYEEGKRGIREGLKQGA